MQWQLAAGQSAAALFLCHPKLRWPQSQLSSCGIFLMELRYALATLPAFGKYSGLVPAFSVSHVFHQRRDSREAWRLWSHACIVWHFGVVFLDCHSVGSRFVPPGLLHFHYEWVFAANEYRRVPAPNTQPDHASPCNFRKLDTVHSPATDIFVANLIPKDGQVVSIIAGLRSKRDFVLQIRLVLPCIAPTSA